MTAKLTMLWVAGIALATCAAIGAGCGGKVEVDGPAPSPSGAGGAPGTTTVGTTSDVVTSTGDAPPLDGSSVGTGSATCDFTGDCGTCQNCAFNGLCAPSYQACLDSMACMGVVECVKKNCMVGDAACVGQCKQQSPEGGALYSEVIDCILCVDGVCKNDCAQAATYCGL